MPIYTHESEVSWFQLHNEGVELALVAHADPGENHGKNIELSRAFDLAAQFGATPINHLLAYEFKMRHPDKFRQMMNYAGSNHTWVTSTLVIYTGDGMKFTQPDVPSRDQILEFGLVERRGRGLNHIITPIVSTSAPQSYRVYDGLFGKYKEYPGVGLNELPLPSFLYVRVPEAHQNILNIVQYPNYRLVRKGNAVLVEVDWDMVRSIPKDQLELGREVYRQKSPWIFNDIPGKLVFPGISEDGFGDFKISFRNPTLGFLDPAEGYGLPRDYSGYTLWTITTSGEGVIIQRPI